MATAAQATPMKDLIFIMLELGTADHRDRTDGHMAVERAQTAWPAGDLYRRAPCQGGTQDADQ